MLLVTLVLQIGVTEHGGRFFRCHIGGLTPDQWAFCWGAAGSVLVWQQLINCVAWVFGDVERGTPGSSGEGGM